MESLKSLDSRDRDQESIKTSETRQDTVHGNLANRKGKSKCGTIYLQLIRFQLLVGQGEEIELPVLPYKALTQVTAMTSDKTCHFVQDR